MAAFCVEGLTGYGRRGMSSKLIGAVVVMGSEVVVVLEVVDVVVVELVEPAST